VRGQVSRIWKGLLKLSMPSIPIPSTGKGNEFMSKCGGKGIVFTARQSEGKKIELRVEGKKGGRGV